MRFIIIKRKLSFEQFNFYFSSSSLSAFLSYSILLCHYFILASFSYSYLSFIPSFFLIFFLSSFLAFFYPRPSCLLYSFFFLPLSPLPLFLASFPLPFLLLSLFSSSYFFFLSSSFLLFLSSFLFLLSSIFSFISIVHIGRIFVVCVVYHSFT